MSATAARLSEYQRREAERLAGDALSRPGDLWIDGVEPSALLDEDGNVVEELVFTALAGVLAGRPQLAKDYGRQRGPSAFGLGTRGTTPAAEPSWSSVLGARSRSR